MIKFYGASGEVVKDWNAALMISKIEVDIFGLGVMPELPLIVLEGYEKYMFQNYGTWAISGEEKGKFRFGGFHVGGYLEDIGWVVMVVDFSTKRVSVNLSKEISSNAIKEGILS